MSSINNAAQRYEIQRLSIECVDLLSQDQPVATHVAQRRQHSEPSSGTIVVAVLAGPLLILAIVGSVIGAVAIFPSIITNFPSQAVLEIANRIEIPATYLTNSKQFFQCCYQGNTSQLRYILITQSIDVNLRYDPMKDGEIGGKRWSIGVTCLMIAADQGRVDTVRMLVGETFQAKVDLQDEVAQWVSLHYAVFRGHLDVVRLLCEDGKAHLNMKTKDGRTALMIAAEQGNYEIVEYLLERGANVNDRNLTSQRSALHLAAAKSGSLSVVRLLSEDGHADLEAKDSYGRTVLMVAAGEGNYEVVEYILTKHVQLDETDEKGRSALHLAVEAGSLDCVRALVEDATSNGRDLIEVMDNEGRTALTLAIAIGQDKVAEYLQNYNNVMMQN